MDEPTNDDGAGEGSIRLRNPRPDEGAALYRLIRDVGTLDVNSSYLYLLICRDFADTTIVAERDGELVGCVTGYRPPAEPDVIFVWQVGVAAAARGQGMASRLLDGLLRMDGCRGVRFLETTVTPSNVASRKMFASLARRLETEMAESAGFTADMFPDPDHEPENRFRIGPFQIQSEEG